MRFLDEAKALYEEKGAALLHDRFPDHEARIAVGLAGRGSQCYGYEDALSRDHDYTPGFCLWLTEEDERVIGLELRRAYRELFPHAETERSAMGSTGMGVMTIGEFYLPYTGCRSAPVDELQWLYLPSHALAEATNGQVWRDDLGQFSRIRQELLCGMPEDVRTKKLAAALLIMAQSGQYNYGRCLRREEQGAAMLALGEFVNAASAVIFLLNRQHMPYYKWRFRAMRALPLLGVLSDALEYLLTGENDTSGQETKQQVIEDICANIVQELQTQRLTCGTWDYLEPHAIHMQQHIGSSQLRSLHILEGY